MGSIILNGDVGKNAIARMASYISIEPTEAQSLIARAANSFYEGGAEILGEGGINEDGFTEWAKSNPGTAPRLMNA